MSLALDQVSSFSKGAYDVLKKDARCIAKEHGAKIRQNPINGVDVTFPDGTKQRYIGWIAARNALVKAFDLAD